MTITTQLNPCSATQTYINYIASGDGDFDEISDFFIKHIQENPQKKTVCARKILDLTVEAYENYLNNTFFGMIQKIFHKVLGNFSKYNRAKEMLSQHPVRVRLEDKAEFDSKVERILADFFTCQHEETLVFLQGPLDTNPSTILIAAPNGDKDELDRTERPIGGGANRTCYRGKCFSSVQGKPEIVNSRGFLTSMPSMENLHMNLETEMIDASKKIALQMKKEYETVTKRIPKDNHVIKMYRNFSIPIGQFAVGITIMDEHRNGNMRQFVESAIWKNMAHPEKLTFLHYLVLGLSGLTDKGHIHRDIKPDNIVISDQPLPVLIDFESCISESDVESKQKVEGTLCFLSPEYASALNAYYSGTPNAETGVIAATTPAMDAWALGLVSFNFMFGKELIGQIFGFNDRRGTNQTRCEHLQNILDKELPQFIAEMEKDGHPPNPEWEEIKQTIRSPQNWPVWKNVIVPLLQRDPKKRATAAATVQALSSMISEIAS